MTLTIIMTVVFVLVVAEFIVIEHKSHVINKYKISFKEALDLCDLPVITLYQGDKKFNFLLDTGSNRSHICKDFIDDLEIKNVNKNTQVSGIEGTYIDVGQGVIELQYKDRKMKDLFLISDLTKAFDNLKASYGVQLHGILGTSFFNRYKYIIDFNQCVFYHKGT